MRTLGLVTIGQAPRDDLTPEILPLMPPCRVVEHGALDGLSADEVAALAPGPGEHALTSKLRDGSSAVFGHDQSLPLVEKAVGRAEADGADVTLIVCSGSFPPLSHQRPLLFTEALAHHATAGLAAGDPVGIVRPLPSQVDDGAAAWESTLGRPVAAATSASPYTDTLEDVAAAAASLADRCAFIVLDCIGYDEQMRALAAQASGRHILLVRTLAARLAGELLVG
ncbi:MAG: AroM family protein [Streptosporangiales bacterium]